MIIANREKGNNVDQFVPAVDIINSQKYIILIDLPGVTIDEIELYR